MQNRGQPVHLEEDYSLLRVIDEHAAFCALQPEWDLFAQKTAAGSPFANFSWFFEAWKTWFKNRSATLKVIELKYANHHYGYLPFVLEAGSRKNLWRKQLKLLLPHALSTPVRLPVDWDNVKNSSQISSLIADTIEAMEWDEIVLEGLENDEAKIIGHWLTKSNLNADINISLSAECPVVTLPQQWESFFQSFSYNKRKEIKRHQRQLGALGKLSLDVLTDSAGIAENFADSIQLSKERYSRAGYKNGFDNCDFADFHLAAANKIGTKENIRLFQLKIDSKTIATLYLFKENDTYHAYQGGFDQKYSKFGPGTLLDTLAMRYGLEQEGIKYFDFGYGQQIYKKRYPHRTRTVSTLSVHRQGIRQQVVKAKQFLTSSIQHFSKDSNNPDHKGASSGADRGKKTLILSIGHVCGVALGMLTPMVLSRRFGIDDFGIYRQFLAIAWLIGLTAQFGMDSGLFYFVKKDPERAATYSLNASIFNGAAAVIIGALMLIFAVPISTLLGSPDLDKEIPYIVGYFLVVLPGQHLPFYLLIQNKIRQATLFAIVNAGANALAAIIGCVYFGSVRAVIIGLTLWGIGKLIWMLNLHGGLNIKSYATGFSANWKLLKSQLKFGLPLGFATLVTVAAKMDRFVVSSFFGLRIFTGYSIGCFDLPLLPNVIDSMSGLMVVDMVKRGEKGAIDGFKKQRVLAIWLSTITQIASLLIPAVVFSMLFAETIIVAFFSDTYKSSSIYFQIYLLSFFILYIDIDHVFHGLARTKTSFKINAIGAVLSISLMFAGLFQWGVMGVLIGRVVGEGITAGIRLRVLGRLLNTPVQSLMPWKTLSQLLIASLVSGVVATEFFYRLGHTHVFVKLVVCAIIFGIFYGIIGILMGVLRFEAILALVKKGKYNATPAFEKT